MKVELFIDFVCPYCFLVEDAVAELARDRGVEVKMQPFELRPDPVPTLRPQDDYLSRVWRESVYPMAARLGVDIRLPTISPQPRSERAFIVAELAAEHELSAEFAHAVFSAFFVADRDIGDDAVLTDIAESVGLAPPVVKAALASGERRARHAEALRYATDIVGVRAVPTFRVGERAYPGVLSATALRRIVDTCGGVRGRLRA